MKKVALYSRSWMPFFTLILCFTAVWYCSNPVLARSPSVLAKEWTPAERWVLDRVEAGMVADLRAQYVYDAQRVLSPKFLKCLLTNCHIFPSNVKKDRRIVRVAYAVLADPVDLKGAEILHKVELSNFQFEDNIDFSESTFHERISFINSSFKTANFNGAVFKAEAEFAHIKVRDSAFFIKAHFAGRVSFRNADVGQFVARQVKFKEVEPQNLDNEKTMPRVILSEITETEAIFDGMIVRNDADFYAAEFAGLVSFRDMDITHHFKAIQAQFTSPNFRPDFNGIKVGSKALFTGATFMGGGTFSGANIRQFEAENARFTNVFLFSRSSENFIAQLDKGEFPDELKQELKNSDFPPSGEVSDKVSDEVSVSVAAKNSEWLIRGKRRTYIIKRDQITRNEDHLHFYLDREVSFANIQVRGMARFDNAIFTTSVNFGRMQVGNTASFVGTTFAGGVSFSRADIGQFEVREAEFNNTVVGVFFNEMRVGSDARFDKAKFAGPVTFHGADIARSLWAPEVEFTSSTAVLNFNDIKVRDNANFFAARFAGGVTFHGADIRQFAAQNALFNTELLFKTDDKLSVLFDVKKLPDDGWQLRAPDKLYIIERGEGQLSIYAASSSAEQEASFADLQVEETAFFDRAVFAAKADFDRLQVGNTASFEEAVFEGPVSFNAAEIGQIEARRAKFADTGSGAYFGGIRVKKDAHFTDAEFAGPVYFPYANIAGTFFAQKAHFNTEKVVSFADMQVGQGAFFDGAIFEATVDFDRLRVESKASFIETKFTGFVSFGAANLGKFLAPNGQFTSASFVGVKIGSDANFSEAKFDGPVNFQEAEITGIFNAQGAHFNNTDNEVYFVRVHMGDAFFNGAEFAGKVDMSHAAFRHLFLCLAIPKKTPTNPFHPFLTLDGMSYQDISVREKEKCKQGKKDDLTDKEKDTLVADLLPQNAKYSSSVYTTLETFFQHQGKPEIADRVFNNQKEREKKEGINWLWNFLLGLLVGHGRSPQRAIYLSFGILLIGFCVFFKEDGMYTEKSEEAPPRYSPLWYSLDLFAPIIDLKAANIWTPKECRKWALIYMRIHIISGAILIPIGLAAFSGILK